MVRLYGRDEVATLVRRSMLRSVPGVDDHCPVLVCEGPPASGKTELLGALAGLLNGRVPYAHLDLATVQASTGEQAVPELLAALAFQLARRTGRYGSLRFPRLVVGHLVMALELDWVDRELARAQVDAALGAHRGVDRWTRALGDFAALALARVPGLEPVPASLLQRGLTGVVRLASRWGTGRRMLLGPYQEWYGRQDREIGEPAIEALVGLNRWAAHDDNPDNRQRIADLLLTAFLADVTDSFATAARADEFSYNCVVLLDNADCELGRTFLSQLVRVRRDHAAGALGAADPVTVVASSGGGLLAELDSTAAPRPAPPGVPGRPWWARYELRPLSLDETNVMVAALALPSGNGQRLAGMIRDLTGGQPAATQLLLDVIADRHSGLVELDDLLRSPRRGVSVEEALRERLLVGVATDALADLVTCAAARDRAGGRLIAQSGLIDNRAVADTAALSAGLWDTGDDCGPTLIRRLLLRQLALRPPQDPASWSNTHRWLRDEGGQRAESTGPDLYYAVALDEWDLVAEALASRLRTHDLSRWLARLHAIVLAPRAPLSAALPGRDTTDRSPAELARELAAPYPRPDPVFTTVVQLLTSLCVARDPLCPSSRSGLYRQIATRYEELAHHTGTGSDELASIVHDYQVRARQWQQAAPPQPVGDHAVGRSTSNPR